MSFLLQPPLNPQPPVLLQVEKAKMLGDPEIKGNWCENTRNQFPRSETHRGPTERTGMRVTVRACVAQRAQRTFNSVQGPQQKPPATDYCCSCSSNDLPARCSTTLYITSRLFQARSCELRRITDYKYYSSFVV